MTMTDQTITIKEQEVPDKEKQRIINNEVFVLKANLKKQGVYLNITSKNLVKIIMEYVKWENQKK